MSGVELRKHLSGQLPDYMIPSYFIQVDSIPLTSNGKVDREKLPGPQTVQANREKVYAAPRSRMEKVIVEVWQEVLQVEKIGVNDHFFDIGGNSLNIVQVNTKLKQVLGKELPLMILFRYTTIRSLAQFIGEQEAKTKINVHRNNRSENLQKGKSDRRQRYEKRSRRTR